MADHSKVHSSSEDPVPSIRAERAEENGPQEADCREVEAPVPSKDFDFSDLTARFAAHGGGTISTVLSSELALDVVLHEIVEQACLATRSSGASIALQRTDGMVCRATSGGNAPELGSRLDSSEGLSGACVRSRQIQCCHDALTDPRADAEVSRAMGVRSIVVYPLVLHEEFIGVLEIFSPRESAFGDRDLQTLEVLSARIVKNVEAQRDLVSSSGAPDSDVEPPVMYVEASSSSAPPVAFLSPSATINEWEQGKISGESLRKNWFDWFTTLAGIVIICVGLLMGVTLSVQMGWIRFAAMSPSPRRPATPSVSPGSLPSSVAQDDEKKISARSDQLREDSGEGKRAVNVATGRETNQSNVPAGGLQVYDRGKEIFRISPALVALQEPEAGHELVRRVEPEYPEQALRQGLQGSVLLDVRIGSDGSVRDIKVLNGDPLLSDAAAAAVKEWKFKAQNLEGRAVEAETQITFEFRLPPR